MPYNGTGTFVRLYRWVTDKANGILINASRMDGEFDGIATALTDCVTRDGQSPATANLPMDGYIHTNVGNATARDQYAVVGQEQDGSYTWCGTAGGSANAITITPSPAIAAYSAGQAFQFVSSAANTGPATLNVSGLGTKSITKAGTTALAAGDIPSGAVVTVRYDGTQFQLLNPAFTGVSSVALTGDGVVFNSTVSGSPITGSGTLAPALLAQAKNTIFAGPSTGSNATPTFRSLVTADLPSFAPTTASLGGDVSLNNTATYFDGPSISQGTSGKWFVSGTVTVVDTSGNANFSAKLWDGTTVIASASNQSLQANATVSLSLSGYISSPAGNLRISVKDTTSTNGAIKFNSSGNSKDSTITAIQIG